MSETPKFVEKFNATFRDRLHAVIDELNLDVDRDPFTKLLANCIASKEYADEVKRELTAERERADRNQEDAERYRYLRIHPSVASETLPSSYQRFWCLVELDTAIDAARRKANAAILKATGDRLDALNRRAAVEQILFDAAAGKRHLPGPEECRALAMKLGVPDELRDPRFDAMLRGESNG